MMDDRQMRVERPLYGGSFATSETGLALPFVLPSELVALEAEGVAARVVEASVARVVPACPHFGVCGGCQYQMASYAEQLAYKREILREELSKVGVVSGEIVTHSAEPYGYRNRIRLRLQQFEGVMRFGYNRRGTTEFLPVVTCPISAPNLIPTAEALLATAAEDKDAAYWLNAAAEVELFANDDLSRVQLTLFCAARTKAPQGSFTRMMNALQQRAPWVVGAAAEAFDSRTGPTGRTLATHGAAGLAFRVGDETYWISRGGFFQVNRCLVDTLVKVVTEGRGGTVAWDLFAGVGLFSRVLARDFAQVTAVEASPVASADLRNALARLGTQHRAVQQTTLEFLRAAVVQRERPELVVLDPPRAGAGLEVCELLTRVAAPEIVYVSCDPTTLARDLAALQAAGYRLNALHLVDLFPQTFHIESIAMLSRG